MSNRDICLIALTSLAFIGLIGFGKIYEDKRAYINKITDVEHTRIKLLLQQERNRELELINKNKIDGGK